MTEAAKGLQTQTLGFPALANENEAELNEAGNISMCSTANTCKSMDGGVSCAKAEVTVGDSHLEHDKVMDKTENGNGFGGTQNGKETSEQCKGNTVMDAEVVDKLCESSIGEFWGKYGENVDGKDDRYYRDDNKELLVKTQVFEESLRSSDDNGGSEFSENGLGKKVDEKGNGFGGKDGGTKSEGLNSNINQCSSDERTVLEAQVVEKLFEPSNGQVLVKNAEDDVGEDYMCKEKINDKTENGDGFGDTLNGGETGEGFNGNIIRCSSDGRVVIGDQEVEKLFKSSNGEFLGKDAEHQVGKDYISDDDDEGLAIKDQVIEEHCRSSNADGVSDFTEDGPGKKVYNENGISISVELPINNNVGNCDGVELEKAGKEGENKDKENALYSVGDLVWSRFNSHPWWPAQIYDPSDASDQAKKYSHKGKKLLVAYFGDGSFSWRSPSQLKPLAENFDELSKQNNSTMFLTAVQCALDDIGRVAELKMTCPCIPEANKAGLGKKAMENAGIKAGVLGPDCDFSKVPFSDFEPTKLLSKLRSIAEANPVKSMLELTGLRICLSAFHRFSGGRKLAFYHEEMGIEGLEDQTRNGNDHSVMQRCGGLFENELNGTRKRKSVANLMKEHNDVEPSAEKKMKSIDKSPISSNKKILSSKNGGDGGHEKALNNNGGSVLEEEAGDMTVSRKRKKSKYLSYPYTDLKLNVEIFRSKRDLEAESVKISKIARVGERMTTAAANLTQSSPILKKNLSGKSNNGGDTSALSGPRPLEEAQMKMTELEVSPEEVVNKIRSAALDPQKNLDSNTFDVVNNFISAYKSVVYMKGSNKSLSSEPRQGVEKQNENFDEMTMAEFIRQKKMENKKAKKTNDGLVFIKEKLKKMTSMVENCGADMAPEMKLSLEAEMKGLLQKMSSMAKPASS